MATYMKQNYDSAYKYIFSNKRIFYQLLTSFVKEDFVKELDIEHITLLEKSFISDEFLRRESDVIYQIKQKDTELYIYILLEFQSTVDKSIPVRMLSYLMQFYDLLQRNSRRDKLPSVFPLMLYNGIADWSVATNIRDLIDIRIPGKYVPSFEYYPIIVKDIPDETLLKVHNLASAIIFLEKRKDEEALREAVDRMIELIRNENIIDVRMFANWFSRMFRQSVNPEDVEKINDIMEVKSMLTLIAEQIEQRGIQQGIQQGMTIETAKKMLTLKYSIADISTVTGLSEDEIEKLKTMD